MTKENRGNLVLAEDDQDDVLIFSSALERLPYAFELRHAKDGDHLFVVLNEGTPDIIFLDINMPCKDGIACIAEIRRDARFDTVPVVMYTAHQRKQFVDEAYSKGANYYLVKVPVIEDLAKQLQKTFDLLLPGSKSVELA